MNRHIYYKIGCALFFTGIFILPSTLFFGAIFLLISALIGTFLNEKKYFQDNWNKSFFLCAIIILISCLKNIFFTNNLYENYLDPNLSLIGTLNWLPFFWLFWGFQPYLNSKQKRKNTSIFLVAGTFPLLISGFGQYFFNWTGPLETLNGLVIWYQRPIETNGLTGPFNNQNYAGCWFSLVFPFCISLFLEKTKNNFYKIPSLFFLLSIGLAGILTTSRNAWASLASSIPLVIGFSSLYWYVPLILSIILIMFLSVFQPLSGELQDLIREFIPKKIWFEFSEERLVNLKVTRIEILASGYKISQLNPIFGLGAGSFPIIYEIQKNLWRGHPHNIILELAISFGYPATVLFVLTISILIGMSAINIFSKKNQKGDFIFLERAWWTSIFLFFITQLFDVQYFDARISITAWIILSGLKLILEEKINSKKLITFNNVKTIKKNI